MASPQLSHQTTYKKEDVLGDVIKSVADIKKVIEDIKDIEKWFEPQLKSEHSQISIRKEAHQGVNKNEAVNAMQDNTAGALSNSISLSFLLSNTGDGYEQEGFKQNLQKKLKEGKTCAEQCQEILEGLQKDMEKKFKVVEEENISGINSSHTRLTDSKPRISVLCCICCAQTEMDSKELCSQTEVDSQLYCPTSSNLVKSVMEKLPLLLIEQLNNLGIKLNIQICNKAHELKKDVPLIVIILQSTRLGTDVSNAVKEIEPRSNVAVLILHHADIHALPSQSSRTILTAQEYKQIDTIIDLGFISDTGIYSCDMNKNALEELTLFIRNKSINR